MTIEAIKKGCNIRMENARTHKANVQAKELPTLYRNMGMTYQGMAEKLNQSQYLTRRQKLFEGKAVFRLLERKIGSFVLSMCSTKVKLLKSVKRASCWVKKYQKGRGVFVLLRVKGKIKNKAVKDREKNDHLITFLRRLVITLALSGI